MFNHFEIKKKQINGNVTHKLLQKTRKFFKKILGKEGDMAIVVIKIF